MKWVSSNVAGELSGWSRFFSFVTFCCALLLAATPQEAKAQFTGYYSLNNFTLTNTGGLDPNGYESSPDSNTLVLTGTNDGSDLAGMTDFTIGLPSGDIFGFYVGSVDDTGGAGVLTVTNFSASGSGFQFAYSFTTSDSAGYEYGGFLIGVPVSNNGPSEWPQTSISLDINGQDYATVLYQLANASGASSSNVPVSADVGTATPEPGSFQLLLIAAVAGIIAWNRRRLRFLFRIRGLAAGFLIVVAAAICFTRPVLAQQQTSYTGTNVTGDLVLTSVVNLSQQALPALGGARMGEEAISAPTPRLHPPLSKKRILGATAQTLPMNGLSVVTATGVTGFNALSHLDQRNANNGNQFSVEPPSESIAVGNGYLLEGVNDAVQIFNTSGAPYLPIVLSSNQVFGVAPEINYSTLVSGVNPNGLYFTDMRVYFDSGMQRWIVLQRDQDNDIYGDELATSHLYMAVSQTADPTGNYNIYVMETTNGSHFGCPCIADYPQIGSDQYGFHIAWNEFASASEEFVDASVLTISKAALASGASQPTAVQFLLPYSTGYEFALQPANVPPGAANFLGNGGVEYLVSSSSSYSEASGVALWALSNTSSLATGNPNVALAEIITPVLNYIVPNVASQPSAITPPLASSFTPAAPIEYLDGGDTRVQALTYASGELFMTFQTGVTDQNGVWVVGGVYIVLSPTFRGGVLAARVVNQGYLLVNGNHLLRPAIAVNPLGVGAIAVTLVGPSWYPSAALIPFSVSSTPSTIQIASQGTGPEDGFTGYAGYGGDGVARWGDYNTAVAATDGSIWGVVEYIGSYPRSTYANWNTYVFNHR